MDNSQRDTGINRFEDIAQAQAYLSTCTSLALRHIDIFSSCLDSRLFSHSDFIANLSDLARRSRQSHVRLLLQDSQPLRGCRHALITLSQRLPSSVELRVVNKDYARVETGFCIADSKSMVFFNNEENSIGFYCEQARAEARHALEKFDTLWETQSHTDPEFKTLAL